MKVLFVSSGNNKGSINIIIKNQGESLRKAGVDVEFYAITGRGILSYLKHVLYLKRQFRRNKYDVVHAHYSFSGMTSSLAGCKPIVVSLMGSDVYSTVIWRKLIRFFNSFFWDYTIVKSPQMKDHISLSNCLIIPNGVNLEQFKPSSRHEAKNKLRLDENLNYVLFAADPGRSEKNFSLAKRAMENLCLNDANI